MNFTNILNFFYYNALFLIYLNRPRKLMVLRCPPVKYTLLETAVFVEILFFYHKKGLEKSSELNTFE